VRDCLCLVRAVAESLLLLLLLGGPIPLLLLTVSP
jgi:hypothetical protein